MRDERRMAARGDVLPPGAMVRHHPSPGTTSLSVISLKHRVYVALRRPWRGSAERATDAWIKAESRALDASGVDLGNPADGPVTMLVANAGYLEFVENWLVHHRRLGRGHVLAIAVDDTAHARMKALDVPVVRCSARQGGDERFAAYGARDFNRITAYKTLYVVLLLRAGYDVLLTDGDTVWLQDPLPHLGAGADLQIQLDTPGVFELDDDVLADPKVCTGFFLARHTPASLAFWRRVLVLQQQLPRLNDQHCANLALRGARQSVSFLGDDAPVASEDTLSVKILDPLQFANGSIYFTQAEAFDARGVDPLMVHANWIHGRERKIEHLRARGLWGL